MSKQIKGFVETKQINNVKVNPIKGAGKVDSRPVRGSALFSELYCNIAIIARKKSGKTSVISKILEECAGPNTTVVVFCSSLTKDDSWKMIEATLKKRGIEFNGYQSIYDTDVEVKGRNKARGLDMVKDLTDYLQGKYAEKEEEDQDTVKQQGGSILVDNDNVLDRLISKQTGGSVENKEEKPKKPKREKFAAPEYIMVFDDLSDELKAPSITSLLKIHRHLKMKIIISTQYIHDLPPSALKQMDYWLLFGGQPIEKLEKVRKDAGLAVTKEQLALLYNTATAEKYSFLYIDKIKDKFRQGFSKELMLK